MLEKAYQTQIWTLSMSVIIFPHADQHIFV